MIAILSKPKRCVTLVLCRSHSVVDPNGQIRLSRCTAGPQPTKQHAEQMSKVSKKGRDPTLHQHRSLIQCHAMLIVPKPIKTQIWPHNTGSEYSTVNSSELHHRCDDIQSSQLQYFAVHQRPQCLTTTME